MTQIKSPAPQRFGRFRTLLAAAPFALISAGQAAAESPVEAEPRVPAAVAAEAGVESASQPGRDRPGHERMARRFDRRSEGVDRRARRGARRDGRSGPAGRWVGRPPAPGRGAPRSARRWEGAARRARRGARRDGRSGPAGRWFGRRLAATLDLTDEQRDQMREAMREISDNRRASRRQVADARRSFQRAVRDPELSDEEIQALGEALGRAQADQALQRRSERERIAGILTEDQREQLEERRERRGPRSRSGRRRG